jgi:hypothetical protein
MSFESALSSLTSLLGTGGLKYTRSPHEEHKDVICSEAKVAALLVDFVFNDLYRWNSCQLVRLLQQFIAINASCTSILYS